MTSTDNIGRLINISTRSQVGTGASILIAGFVIGGQGTSGTESLLIRGSGPALAAFGVAGTLARPAAAALLRRHGARHQRRLGRRRQDRQHGRVGGRIRVGDPSSHDSALLRTLPAGAYTAQISGQSGDTGVALAEVYDATPAGSYTPANPRLVNISARVQVGTGGNILIAGFVIGGSTARTVLLRASGPALVPFGVTGTLPDPQLQLFSGATVLAGNTGWGGNAEISAAAASVGALWVDRLQEHRFGAPGHPAARCLHGPDRRRERRHGRGACRALRGPLAPLAPGDRRRPAGNAGRARPRW